MKSIRCSADMAKVLASPIDADLRRLLALRRDQLIEHDGYDLGDLAHFIVVEADDPMAAIKIALGFDPSVNLVDGACLGQPGFTPSWEWREYHLGWIELLFVLSDDGFGHVLLIPDAETINPTLAALIRA